MTDKFIFDLLQAIWPYSGHYLPTQENFREFISFLEEHSVNLENVKVKENLHHPLYFDFSETNS